MQIDFDRLDEQIEHHEHQLDGCRQAMTLSRAIMVAATIVILLVMTVAGQYRTPVVVFSALTAIIAGIVWLGANRTSAREAEAALKQLQLKKADAFARDERWRDLGPTLH